MREDTVAPVRYLVGAHTAVVVCRDVDIVKAVADTRFALFFNHGKIVYTRWLQHILHVLFIKQS
jgi:acyl-CoA reductase-like NAD-dependent aldehyde dehydrogenase